MPKASAPDLPDLHALPGDAAPEAGDSAAGSWRTGQEIIADHVRRLPGRPGVYRMIAADGEVLYVGKARSLRARVASYAKGIGHSNRIARMIALTRGMEFAETATETEALLLEANLIKRLRPRFNILMRDDKSFPYIALRKDHAAPQISKHRGARSRNVSYFGPFASAWAVDATLTTLQKAFLLRSCSDSVYAHRDRPCMLHQIRRCAAPCVGLVDAPAYQRLVDEAEAFLSGRSGDLQERLAGEMHAAAEGLDFERAARLRDRIRALASIRASQDAQAPGLGEADLFAAHMEGGVCCVQVFFFRAGQNWGNRAYFPRHEKDASVEEVVEAFIAQFYDDKPPPPLVLVSHMPASHALLEAALAVRAGRSVAVRRPERGAKRALLDRAIGNAREALGRKLAETGTQARLLAGLADAFGLAAPPDRIEIYDNSHIQGRHAVGCMVVAGPDGFEKGQYRKWTIDAPGGGDDFAMMREVFNRRFARLKAAATGQSDPDGPPPPATDMEGNVVATRAGRPAPEPAWPDLIVIDGGAAQLAAVLEVAQTHGVAGEIAFVAMAKGVDRDAGREVFHMPGRTPFRLEMRDPVLYFLQRLRDEAHRFAIGAHRQKRQAAQTRNPLDDISGIGPGRKRALLARFGSAKAVARASVSELMQVDGVNAAMAGRIHAHFQKG